VEELETVEDLINAGDDEKVMLFRRHQLDAFQMVAVVVSTLTERICSAPNSCLPSYIS
jgi:hypothetical protein